MIELIFHNTFHNVNGEKCHVMVEKFQTSLERYVINANMKFLSECGGGTKISECSYQLPYSPENSEEIQEFVLRQLLTWQGKNFFKDTAKDLDFEHCKTAKLF